MPLDLLGFILTIYNYIRKHQLDSPGVKVLDKSASHAGFIVPAAYVHLPLTYCGKKYSPKNTQQIKRSLPFRTKQIKRDPYKRKGQTCLGEFPPIAFVFQHHLADSLDSTPCASSTAWSEQNTSELRPVARYLVGKMNSSKRTIHLMVGLTLKKGYSNIRCWVISQYFSFIDPEWTTHLPCWELAPLATFSGLHIPNIDVPNVWLRGPGQDKSINKKQVLDSP